jgi:PKD repeat protein
MPPRLRAAISRGVAGVAVVFALLVTACTGSALADRGPAIHGGAIGGVATPSGAAGSGHAPQPDGEIFGGGGSSGSSPGGGTPPLLYAGGPVMHAVTTQVIAWAPTGYSFPSGYVSGYEQYLSDLSTGLGLSTNISSIAKQYMDASGPALSSLTNNAPISDTDAYPSSGCTVSGTTVCLTENQILTELSTVISANALSVNVNHSYIVLLPPAADTCFDSSAGECEDQAFCGYHTAISIGGGSDTTFTLLPYPQSSYSNAAGQCYEAIGPSSVSSAVMALDSIGAHELFESATDPLVGSGYVDSSGDEVADECAWTWGAEASATGGGHYNQLVNSDQYMIQEMWSNQANACEQGVSSTAQASISAPGSAVTSTATGFSAALTGDSSTASSYEWSYLAPDGMISSDVSTSASPQLTFSAAGTYTVWVQITDAAGGTVTGVSDITVSGAQTPAASFGYAIQTRVPATGSAVSFTSTASASSSQSITSTSWSFGDGSTGSGAAVAHAYTAAGTYTVTLRVTQTNGQSSQASETVTVSSPPTAAISWIAANPVAGTSATFSSDAAAGAGAISGYSWSFGDGSSSTASSPSHAYSSAGTYTVTLTVTQSDGLTGTATRSIDVAAAATQTAPVSGGSPASAGSSTSSGSPTAPGASGTGTPATTPTASLTQALSVATGSNKIATLLRTGASTSAVNLPSVSGAITITWYAAVAHHRVLVARGTATVRSGITAHVAVKLTVAGRALLRRSKTLRITASGSYDFGSSSVTGTRTITLRR